MQRMSALATLRPLHRNQPAQTPQPGAPRTGTWWRRPAPLGLVSSALLAAGLATHDAIADGPLAVYARGLLLVAVIAGAVWALLAAQLGTRSPMPAAAALAVVATAVGLHLFRLASPLVRGIPGVAIQSRFDTPAGWQSAWDVATTGGGTAAQTAAGLELASVPGGAAYVIARIDAPRALPLAWWMPVAASDLVRVDEVTWRAAVVRRGGYTGIFQSRRLVIQAVASGISITAPNARGDVDDVLVHETAALDGEAHEWRLVAGGQTIKLVLDGRLIWSGPQHEPVDEVRLGDARADPEHSGVVTLFQAAYRRRYVRPENGPV